MDRSESALRSRLAVALMLAAETLIDTREARERAAETRFRAAGAKARAAVLRRTARDREAMSEAAARVPRAPSAMVNDRLGRLEWPSRSAPLDGLRFAAPRTLRIAVAPRAEAKAADGLSDASADARSLDDLVVLHPQRVDSALKPVFSAPRDGLGEAPAPIRTPVSSSRKRCS